MARSQRDEALGGHVVTVFSIKGGGRCAWCTCGERFDVIASDAAALAESWASCHGTAVRHYPLDVVSAA